MVSYKDISGLRIKKVSSDPSNLNEGEMWYNTTSNTFKVGQHVATAWSAGGSLTTARSQLAGTGTKAAGLAFGGTPSSSTAPSATNGDKCESYDGSSWTAADTMVNATRQNSGFGTQTAAVCFGGYSDDPGQGYQNKTEDYDGTSWSASNVYPMTISNGAGAACGTQTAGLNVGGYTPDTYTDQSAEYNGVSWSAGNTAPYGASNMSQVGIQTVALSWGGNDPSQGPPSIVNTVVTYDGTSFAAETSTPAVTQVNGSSGVQTSCIIYGGGISTNYSTSSLEWDGSAWTAGVSLATGRQNAADCGISSSKADAFFAGGDYSETTVYNNTEEYTPSYTGAKTVTTS